MMIKSSLTVLTLAVLMSGCAKDGMAVNTMGGENLSNTAKGSITLYGQKQTDLRIDQSIRIDTIGLCADEDYKSIIEYSNITQINNVPTSFSETVNEDTSSTASIETKTFKDGNEKSLKVCFLDQTKKAMRFIFSDVVSNTQPLTTLKNDKFDCLESEASPNVKFVTCNA